MTKAATVHAPGCVSLSHGPRDHVLGVPLIDHGFLLCFSVQTGACLSLALDPCSGFTGSALSLGTALQWRTRWLGVVASAGYGRWPWLFVFGARSVLPSRLGCPSGWLRRIPAGPAPTMVLPFLQPNPGPSTPPNVLSRMGMLPGDVGTCPSLQPAVVSVTPLKFDCPPRDPALAPLGPRGVFPVGRTWSGGRLEFLEDRASGGVSRQEAVSRPLPSEPPVASPAGCRPHRGFFPPEVPVQQVLSVSVCLTCHVLRPGGFVPSLVLWYPSLPVLAT